jgi:hypothetical protein
LLRLRSGSIGADLHLDRNSAEGRSIYNANPRPFGQFELHFCTVGAGESCIRLGFRGIGSGFSRVGRLNGSLPLMISDYRIGEDDKKVATSTPSFHLSRHSCRAR